MLRRIPLIACLALVLCGRAQGAEPLERGFAAPPPSVRPWVYWFIMDGNLTREGITADLEAMKAAGIGGVILMEVNVGVPRGPVQFMSPQWPSLFRHAVNEAERLGLEITLNAGPGWTGSGGPWVKPEQSMQHLVASSVEVKGPSKFDAVLPRPARRPAYFGEDGLPAALRKSLDDFYADVAVVAFPTPAAGATIADIDEKALYLRHPYSSRPGTKPYLPAPASFPALASGAAISRGRIVDLSGRLQPGGRLEWDVPPGQWTILRFGRTSTGANTRPAPAPGLGPECDKFDRAALDAHFDAFIGALVREIGPRPRARRSGWTMLHMDSWEMGAQNWTGEFRAEFRRRRGYDPLEYLPAMTGRVVESLEISERFLWDVRQTAQELVIENYAGHLKELGRRYGFGLSIEPYDTNPCADLTLGGVADVPMCEFWAAGHGFNTTYSCIEAVSIAHTMGRPVVAAEAFTAGASEAWRLHPGAMKAQADWAFCTGVNRLVFHRYAHQPWLDRWPGMTMGPYGVHYERTQTWWGMVGAWHEYVARCQFMLRRGLPVADVCYLAPEGAPHVFRPPPSALRGSELMPDRRGYNFDGCAPEVLLGRMSVENGRLVLPDGMQYRVLVLPETETMTPALLRNVRDLVRAGATVFGPRPVRSPSLSGYPQCDDEVRQLAAELWGAEPAGANGAERSVGRGKVIDSGRQRKPRRAPAPPLPSNAKWIWHAADNPAAAPVGRRYFRREFELDREAKIESARLAITADNAFTVRVNGRAAGQGDNFTHVYTFDIKSLLRPGRNVLAVTASNGGERPNPAGVIGAAEIRLAGGHTLGVLTDGRWESAAAENADSAAWRPVKELGAYGVQPWGQVGKDLGTWRYPPPYGDFAEVIRVLSRMGVRPDFQSDVPLRYAHRRDGDTDIYLVANGADSPVLARCDFRVTARRPTIWDPVSGKIFAMDSFEEMDGRTRLALALDPHGSVFVVFRPGPTPGIAKGETRCPRLRPLGEVSGPWEVHFQPGRGAPEKVTLDQLVDWTKHPDDGVRHFSGVATYRTSFRVASQSLTQGRRLYLDLGQVQVMARVKLNGRDLGVVWKTPFRLDITGAARAGENSLEVDVANLWPNRLIGDRSLPPDKRVAWTTWNPFHRDGPLVESGLLGPVTVQIAEEGKAR